MERVTASWRARYSPMGEANAISSSVNQASLCGPQAPKRAVRMTKLWADQRAPPPNAQPSDAQIGRPRAINRRQPLIAQQPIGLGARREGLRRLWLALDGAVERVQRLA